MPLFIGTEDNETILGASLADSIFGRGGNDLLSGLGGDNLILDEAGKDVLVGGEGRGALQGGAGADTMRGGEGSDLILAGAGNDAMTGGAGDDTFRFEGRTFADRITDFSVTDDKIEIAVQGVDAFGDLRITETAAVDPLVAWGPLTAPSSVLLLGVAPAALSSDDFAFG
jgi:Ca2+-binding RTX toxin-like protein